MSKEQIYKGRLAAAFWVCLVSLIISAIFINDYKEVIKKKANGKQYSDREFTGYNSVAITFTSLFGIATILCFVAFVKAPV